MVEENDGTLHPEQSEAENESNSDNLYRELNEVLPEREVDLPQDGVVHQDLTGREEESPNLSDVQVGTKTLFPEMDNKTLSLIMVSEVFPEAYRPFQSMLVKDMIKNSANKDLSVVDIIARVNTAESIAFAREGRFDELAIIGVANRAKTDADNNKLLGG